MIDKKDLVMYECPTISEFIGIKWIQTIIARYLAYKVNKKYKRYLFRIKRDNFFKNLR